MKRTSAWAGFAERTISGSKSLNEQNVSSFGAKGLTSRQRCSVPGIGLDLKPDVADRLLTVAKLHRVATDAQGRTVERRTWFGW